MRWDKTFKKVEKALGFKLHDWQKAYISLESDFVPEGRCIGATTAFILRWLLNYGEKIDMFEGYYPGGRYFENYERLYWCMFTCDNDISNEYVVRHYPSMVTKINYLLINEGVDTCFHSANV